MFLAAGIDEIYLRQTPRTGFPAGRQSPAAKK